MTVPRISQTSVEDEFCNVCGDVPNVHRQVHLVVGDQQACIDVAVAPLLAECWILRVGTEFSCEAHEPGVAAIVFASPEDWEKVARALSGSLEKADPLRARVLGQMAATDDLDPMQLRSAHREDDVWRATTMTPRDLLFDDEQRQPMRVMVTFPVRDLFPAAQALAELRGDEPLPSMTHLTAAKLESFLLERGFAVSAYAADRDMVICDFRSEEDFERVVGCLGRWVSHTRVGQIRYAGLRGVLAGQWRRAGNSATDHRLVVPSEVVAWRLLLLADQVDEIISSVRESVGAMREEAPSE
jgi:hypothetical protein